MRRPTYRRTLLRIAVPTALAGLLALGPTSVASAAPAPHPDGAAAAKHHDHRGKPKKATKRHPDSPAPAPSPGPSPRPSPGPSPTTAVVGSPLPARHAQVGPRRLSGQTLGALSYDAPDPVAPSRDGRESVLPAAAAPSNAPPANTWIRHGRGDWPVVSASVRSAVDHPTAPLVVGALIALFVLVQHQIDRSDPKLARGRLPEGPDLPFGPPRRWPTSW